MLIGLSLARVHCTGAHSVRGSGIRNPQNPPHFWWDPNCRNRVKTVCVCTHTLGFITRHYLPPPPPSVISWMRPRLGKLACPRVNDDQKIDVDDQKLNSGRPHDYWILENLFYKLLFIISIFLLSSKWNTLEDDHKYLWTTSFSILVVL